MTGQIDRPDTSRSDVRAYPEVAKDGDGKLTITVDSDHTIQELVGMKTTDAANGVFCTALEALGKGAEDVGGMASAMFAELEPTDAVEAMLVAQMTATHMAMTKAAGNMTRQTNLRLRESSEKAMVRLGRLFTYQMDALKKYRRKAQQVVRVERVTVHEGGQAIVGDVVKAGKR